MNNEPTDSKNISFDDAYSPVSFTEAEELGSQSVKNTKDEKEPFSIRAERFIDKYTPQAVKNFCNRVLDMLPESKANWIREHRFFTICILYIIRGLFLRPSMWLVYAAIWAYFKN